MFKLAMIQMRVGGGRKEENLRRAQELIRQASSEGADVVVLPEALTLGWTHRSALAEADEIPNGMSCARFRDAAVHAGVYVCSGLIERAGTKIYNAAVLVDPAGNVLLHHRKVNELEIGRDLYALGDRLEVISTPLGTFGVMICADGFARGQCLTRTLGYMGADIVLSPSAWAVPADHDNEKTPYGARWLTNYQSVARDFRIWIAGVSNVGWISDGPWNGRKCIGCSLLMDPDGNPAVRGPYGEDAETILYADIRLVPRPAQGTGWEDYWSGTPEAGSPAGGP